MGKTIIVGALLFLCWHATAAAQDDDDDRDAQIFDEDRDDDVDEDDEVDESIELPYADDNQFAQVEVLKGDDGPTDEDGRYALKTRGAFGKGVLFATASDGFALQLRARGQFQAFARFADPSDSTGFLIRRLRLLIAGHALRKRLSYYIQLGFSEHDLEDDARVPLRDAFFTWHFGDELNLRFGQMKVPFSRQRVTSSSRLQLVERSVLSNELNLDRDAGLQVFGFAVPNYVHYYLGVFAGDGRNRLNLDGGLLYVVRLEVFPTGAFNDGDESDATRSSRLRFALGGAAAYNMRARRTRSTQGEFFQNVSYDYAQATGDLRLYWSGWSLAAEYLRRETVNEHGSAPELVLADPMRRDRHGFFVQSGLRISERFELAARAGRSWSLLESGPNDFDRTELTGGFSWYHTGHNFKVQANFTSLLSDSGDEHVARVQTQVFF